MADRFDALVSAMQNFNARQALRVEEFLELSRGLADATDGLNLYDPVMTRLTTFLEEANRFVTAVDSGDLENVRRVMRDSVQLFKGATGVRHVDFIGHRPR
jgi:iron uptake system EfeUOB component EfeO/EfeM